MTALHQVADQYVGIVLKASINVQHKSGNIVSVEVNSAEYADVHANLSQGWSSPIPESQLRFQQMPLSSKLFELKYKNGKIDGIVISKNIPTWELNILKSIASQLQIDTHAENFQKSHINSLGVVNESAYGVYKTMEDSINGECETMYNISPLFKILLQNKPQLAPMHNRADGQIFDIVKTINFNNCLVQPNYHFGITGLTNWRYASNQMGHFLSRSSMSRIIISGSLQYYTIQSSVTTNKVIISPFLFDNKKGMVVSRMNLTLVDIKPASSSPQSFPNSKTIKNLVYEYNPAVSDEKNQRSQRMYSYDDNVFGSSYSSYETSYFSKSYKNDDSNKQKDTLDYNKRIPRLSNTSLRVNDDFVENRNNQQNRYYQSRNSTRETNFKDSKYHNSADSPESSIYFSRSDFRDGDNSSFSSFFMDRSEKDTWQPKPKLSEAPEIPFLPMFISFQGHSIHSDKDIQGTIIVKKIAEQIGSEVMMPSAMCGQKTLKKFTILTQILRTLNAKQMEEATKELFFPLSRVSSSSSNDAKKYQAWVAFRDAIAQAGTGPALVTIKEWIQSKKVQGFEAAELLGVLPNSALFPNAEYMDTFFHLAISSEVQDQQFLNTSAILSFTDLARKAFISRSTAYNYFPVQVFGSLKPKKEQPVIQKYVLYIAQCLKQAVSQKDSIKIRTMIAALGNLAHPIILKVFEPYLEGKIPVTNFQRLTIVTSLSKLAKVYPKVARPVLFSIYQNTEEATEIRVAAVFHIMRTNPPAQMLQHMAQFTNDDQDPQVISAVKSAIKSASKLQNPDFLELQMNARSAVNLLNPKKMPAHFSKRVMHSYFANELNLAYKQAISYIGSDDSFLPSSIFYSLRRNIGGLRTKAAGFGAMSSSIDALMNLIEDQFADDLPSSSDKRPDKQSWQVLHQSSGFNWNFKTIENMLNIQKSKQEQVEAQLFLHALSGKLFLPIDNHTIEMLPQIINNAAASLHVGKSFNYSKIINKQPLTVAFATAMGLPFVFTLQTPSLLYIGGQAQAENYPDLVNRNSQKIQVPQSANGSIELQLVYYSCAQSQMGFIAPFNRQEYVAGVDRNFQLNIPIRTEVEIDTINKNIAVKFEPHDQHSKQNVFEYSSEPYTAMLNILWLIQNPHKQIQENSNRKTIHVRPPNQILKTVCRDITGFAFDIVYHSEQKFLDFTSIYNKFHKHQDFLSAVINAWAEESINLSNFTLYFNPQKSSARYARFSTTYFDKSNYENNNTDCDRGMKSYQTGGTSDVRESPSDSERASPSEWPNLLASTRLAKTLSTASGPKNRLKELLDCFPLEKINCGIHDSKKYLVNITAEFEGQIRTQYGASIVIATSNESTISRLLFYSEKNPTQPNNDIKPSQIVADVEFTMPSVPLMNFNKAINADPTCYVNGGVEFGGKNSQFAQIRLKGKMQRSQARLQYLEQSPMAQKCKQEMLEGNTVQYACQCMTSQANLLDQYKFSVYFDKLPSELKNVIYKAYDVLRYAAYQYVNEDLISTNNPSNRIELEANFAPDLKSVSVSFVAPLLTAEFHNVRLNRFIAPLLIMHPEYSPFQRFAQRAFKGQQFPTCVIDNTQAQTFDSKSYPIKLGKCWHVMFHYTPKKVPNRTYDDRKISILVRDASSACEKEMKIVIGDHSIHLQPSLEDIPALVKVNGQLISICKNQLTAINDQDGKSYAQIYVNPEQEIRIYASHLGIEVQYDGKAIKVKAQNSYRSEVHGLCGTFNTQPEDDFTTPQDCVLENPFEFAASYALDDDSCLGSANELKLRAQKKVSNGECFSQ